MSVNIIRVGGIFFLLNCNYNFDTLKTTSLFSKWGCFILGIITEEYRTNLSTEKKCLSFL
ncbi:MAG: hypothetical protein BM557_01975 [Flavobacterium sp. MedPE-SWcel]|nr:MAG: hypothetical protein BM557_01975 [Flavobacterium sp. MedPE-SWcel]